MEFNYCRCGFAFFLQCKCAGTPLRRRYLRQQRASGKQKENRSQDSWTCVEFCVHDCSQACTGSRLHRRTHSHPFCLRLTFLGMQPELYCDCVNGKANPKCDAEELPRFKTSPLTCSEKNTHHRPCCSDA